MTELFYLALRNISKKWTMQIWDWKAGLNRFTIQLGERILLSYSKLRLHKIPDTPTIPVTHVIFIFDPLLIERLEKVDVHVFCCY
ncbi:hypothetical protein NTG1052_140124 [Candidatus Nitrotoga sp. 1052]|nr:hypothetical protein NTG1052_140124 [Candidatus Nitrotoga sp. 1052]